MGNDPNDEAPVTPADVERGLPASADEQAEFRRHVREINGMLREGDWSYSCSLFSSSRMEDLIVRAFSAWDVTRVHDWRDGDYLEFRRPR